MDCDYCCGGMPRLTAQPQPGPRWNAALGWDAPITMKIEKVTR